MKNATNLLNGMPYVHSTDMDRDYLKRKFAKIRRDQAAEQSRQQAKTVTPLQRKVAK